jgi:hypothetical protein
VTNVSLYLVEKSWPVLYLLGLLERHPVHRHQEAGQATCQARASEGWPLLDSEDEGLAETKKNV